MKQTGSMNNQRCTHIYLLMIVVMIAVVMFVYTTKEEQSPDYSRFQGDHINHGKHDGSNNPRTLNELVIDKDASPEFSLLANVTLRRRSLPNYYIHGLKSNHRDDYYGCDIAFIHLHKAGGSTTKSKLRYVSRQVKMKSISMSFRHTTEVYDRFLEEGSTSKPTVFWGGFSFGICDILQGRPCSYMSVLRDPYDRIISAYFYCLRKHPPALCGPVNPKDVSITAWAIHQGSYSFNQLLIHKDSCRDLDVRYDEYVKPYQDRTKNIIKYAPGLNVRSCWFRLKAILEETVTLEQRRALLNYILDHLEDWFAVIGLLEDYKSSLELLDEAYHLPAFTSNIENIANKGKVRAETKDTQIKQMKRELHNSKEVREALYDDIMIYEKAKQIFKLQKEEFSRLKYSGTNSSHRAD